MILTKQRSTTSIEQQQGELFSLLLRLEPEEAGQVLPGWGNHIQAAFLDLVRQGDPALADDLHRPNQRRPYTLSLLKGFHHLTEAALEEALLHQQPVDVAPGQHYWLRITMLKPQIFELFLQRLLLSPQSFALRIGTASFRINRFLAAEQESHPWVDYTTFAQLMQEAGMVCTHYRLEFASPTAFSKGQCHWGKQLLLFPGAADVFEGIARQWECFAPEPFRLAQQGLTADDVAAWCNENVIVTHYELKTRYLPSRKFGMTGFLGHVTYEVKGAMSDPIARWLTPLARFVLFSGVGYKTAMGMGQCRWLNQGDQAAKSAEEGGEV
jgi:CRISPR-associated endoribonuclease Cas6